MNAIAKIRREPEVEPLDGGKRALQVWDMPTDEGFLGAFLTDMFTNYWDQIVFGPIIEGAAYELSCPVKPTHCRVFDGYLTVSFGGPHFHLCVGDCKGSPKDPTPEDLMRRRRPSKARIFRRLDKDGAPQSWGFEMWNGDGVPMVSIFFASPFLSSPDKVNKKPKWERLAMWREVSARYLGREPEDFDATGRGFVGGH